MDKKITVSKFLGTVVNAARAIAYQVNAAMTSFSNNVALSFRPQIISSNAADDKQRVEQLFISSSRACFVLMTLLTMPLLVEVGYVLSLWLGGRQCASPYPCFHHLGVDRFVNR